MLGSHILDSPEGYKAEGTLPDSGKVPFSVSKTTIGDNFHHQVIAHNYHHVRRAKPSGGNDDQHSGGKQHGFWIFKIYGFGSFS